MIDQIPRLLLISACNLVQLLFKSSVYAFITRTGRTIIYSEIRTGNFFSDEREDTFEEIEGDE